MAEEAKGTGKKTVTVVGFGLRLVAAVFDALLLFILSLFVIGILGFIGVFAAYIDPKDPAVAQAIAVTAGVAVSIAYYVGFWTKSGQTPAKSTLGMKVVGADGQPLSTGRALLRYVGYLVSGLVLAIGFLWVVFDKKRQGWHDKMAGSYVVPVEARFSSGDDVEFAPTDPRPKWIWLVVWVFLAIALPGLLLSSLFLLGPVITAQFANLLGG